MPHTLLVHPGLFRGKDPRPTRARICRQDDSVEAEFLDERPLQGLGPRLLFPRDTVMRHTDRFILPSITRVDYTFGDAYAFHITSQCTQRESARILLRQLEEAQAKSAPAAVSAVPRQRIKSSRCTSRPTRN